MIVLGVAGINVSSVIDAATCVYPLIIILSPYSDK